MAHIGRRAIGTHRVRSAGQGGVGKQAADATVAYEDPNDDTDGWAIWGLNRYQTATSVANTFFPGPRYTGIAAGTNWPDALAGGALLGTLGSPLLLVPGGAAGSLTDDTWRKLWHEAASISTLLVFGGVAVVNDGVAKAAARAISGPLGYVSGTSLLGSTFAGPALSAAVRSGPAGSTG